MPCRLFAKASSLVVGLVSVLLSVAGTLDLLSFEGVGIRPGGPLWCRLVHPFVHVGVLHALLNVYVFWQLVFFFPFRLRHLLLAYVVSCSCPCVVALWSPSLAHGLLLHGSCVAGLSGVVFFLMGGVVWRVARPIRFCLMLLGWQLFGMALGSMAVGLHLYCFAAGVVMGKRVNSSPVA
ncbi:MAG: hypothetical protein J5529_05360 [Prevotella sp.]|nr:hypothetical protein [Prevotella sp.]